MEKRVLETVQNNGNKKFKIKAKKNKERDVDIEIPGNDPDADFIVQKLDIEGVGLPSNMPNNGPAIVWLNNFAIKKKSTNAHINQSYKASIAGLSALQAAGKKIVIFDGNSNNGQPYEVEGTIVNDTLELSDGDPAIGNSPP